MCYKGVLCGVLCDVLCGVLCGVLCDVLYDVLYNIAHPQNRGHCGPQTARERSKIDSIVSIFSSSSSIG